MPSAKDVSSSQDMTTHIATRPSFHSLEIQAVPVANAPLSPPAPQRDQDWALPTSPFALAELLTRNDRFDQRRPDLRASREHNHTMVDVLHRLQPVDGLSLLDLGCSYRGWALERALQRGAAYYLGIGLEVTALTVEAERGCGELRAGNAEALDLPDSSFDLGYSVSTFEHFGDCARVLQEMHRVLRPGGHALVSFEAVWSAAIGHHLHHLPGGEVVPPWSHLLLTPERMRSLLAELWPTDSPVSVDEAVRMMYHDPFINRRTLAEQRRLFAEGPLKIEWSVELPDEVPGHREVAEAVALLVPHTVEELLVRGFTLWLSKGRIDATLPSE